MDVREKLVDIVCDATQINGCIHSCRHQPCAMVRGIVDALIDNGVTVHEWISVKDRLPECSGKYLVCTNRKNVYQTKFYLYPEETGGHWGQKDKGKSITHWCYLPQPPKGE